MKKMTAREYDLKRREWAKEFNGIVTDILEGLTSYVSPALVERAANYANAEEIKTLRNAIRDAVYNGTMKQVALDEFQNSLNSLRSQKEVDASTVAQKLSASRNTERTVSDHVQQRAKRYDVKIGEAQKKVSSTMHDIAKLDSQLADYQQALIGAESTTKGPGQSRVRTEALEHLVQGPRMPTDT